MLYGKVVHKFTHKGKEVILRYPRLEDTKELISLGNSLVKERAYVTIQEKLTEKKEMEYLLEEIKKIEDKKSIILVVEVDGKVMGSTGVERKERPEERHVGKFGIIFKKEIRNIKLGQRITPLVLKEAKKQLKIKIAQVTVYDRNKKALHVYGKCGFKKAGEIKKGVKYYGKYLGKVTMVKYL
jgi:RimJ/RimL family protein N-acetyltransferase